MTKQSVGTLPAGRRLSLSLRLFVSVLRKKTMRERTTTTSRLSYCGIGISRSSGALSPTSRKEVKRRVYQLVRLLQPADSLRAVCSPTDVVAKVSSSASSRRHSSSSSSREKEMAQCYSNNQPSHFHCRAVPRFLFLCFAPKDKKEEKDFQTSPSSTRTLSLRCLFHCSREREKEDSSLSPLNTAAMRRLHEHLHSALALR